jgi:hypothetical protein
MKKLDPEEEKKDRRMPREEIKRLRRLYRGMIDKE